MAEKKLTMKDLRPEVRKFALAMERKLRANDHKGTWKNDNVMRLHRRIRDETEELFGQLVMVDRSKERVLNEAADVANFAMFVADVAGAL